MKVVHLSQTDAGAGAGRAAYRIHRMLLASGVASSMIVGDKRTGDETVSLAHEGWPGDIRSRSFSFLEAKLARRLTIGRSGFFSPASFGYFNPSADPRVLAADIVCLYWINGGFIRPEGLADLTMPVVWRLSDTWPFSGGCHYPAGCDRFAEQCGECPQLAKRGAADRSRQLWQRKQRAWRNLDLTIAAPSQWIAGLARRSSLFSERPVVVIPTGVDIERFRPIDRLQARARFGIPQDRSVVMFGALDPEGDARKGFKQLCAALDILGRNALQAPPLAVVFGRPPATGSCELPIQTIFLGQLDDDESLAAAYSAADVVLVPSLEDNLPNVALEAIACGTPVVGFEVCGMPEIVRHQWNGFLGKYTNGTELAEGIRWTLQDADRLVALSQNARKMAEEHFDLRRQGERYHVLYADLLAHRRSRDSTRSGTIANE